MKDNHQCLTFSHTHMHDVYAGGNFSSFLHERIKKIIHFFSQEKSDSNFFNGYPSVYLILAYLSDKFV